jgi:hypothetical protein
LRKFKIYNYIQILINEQNLKKLLVFWPEIKIYHEKNQNWIKGAKTFFIQLFFSGLRFTGRPDTNFALHMMLFYQVLWQNFYFIFHKRSLPVPQKLDSDQPNLQTKNYYSENPGLSSEAPLQKFGYNF